jgi:hypothetical protein
MPKAPAAARLVVRPMKWRPMSSPAPPSASNQRRAEWALVMVSTVVKVLDAIRNTVLRGCRRFRQAASSWPSTLLTKCRRLPESANASSASTAICGPRSEPPMPMFTTSVMAGSARRVSAKSSIASSVLCTSLSRGCSAGVTASPGADRGQRSRVCSTARPSVVLMASPANIASRCSSSRHSCASASRAWVVAASMRLRDRSANTWGAFTLKRSNRSGSAAKAWRRSKARPVCS